MYLVNFSWWFGLVLVFVGFLFCFGVFLVFFWRCFVFFLLCASLSLSFSFPFLRQKSKAVRVQRPGRQSHSLPQPPSTVHPQVLCTAPPQKQNWRITSSEILVAGEREGKGWWPLALGEQKKPQAWNLGTSLLLGSTEKHVWSSQDHTRMLAWRLSVTWCWWGVG